MYAAFFYGLETVQILCVYSEHKDKKVIWFLVQIVTSGDGNVSRDLSSQHF